jgi:hypothetical protein
MVVESTLRFLKMMVAEDATTMEEVLVEVLVVEDAKVALTVKEVVLLQEEKVVEMAVSEAIEAQLLKEKVVSEVKEAVKEVVLHQEEKADFQIERLDVLKVLEMLQDQKDLEEVNIFR